ncbi:MAG TPA: hypothetical protein DDW36_00655 [Candidatus Magasanikbacteria bacterium]|nr:hypothetical protein [Candidatus Magasanikbacteria bacterium]
MSKKRKLRKLPRFKNEDEEREFWAQHDIVDYFNVHRAKRVSFPHLKSSTKTISLRLPEPLLKELKRQADKRDVPYQSFIKVILADRVRQLIP